MRKLYLFVNLNYYIGESLPEAVADKGVILTENVVEGKYPKVNIDETGVDVEWVDDEVIPDDVR